LNACLLYTIYANKRIGGPIYVGRKRREESKQLQTVVVNNKISNVTPGGGVSDRGVGDSERICEAVANELGLASNELVLPSSTGIIGWRLPVNSILAAIPAAKKTLQNQSILPAAEGICTTDRYPKAKTIRARSGDWSITGIAKGAGMIEPNMATMLVYIMTDLDLPKDKLQCMLEEVVDVTFNTISIDGDQSTSDTCVLLSSKKVQVQSESDVDEFKESLLELCQCLAEDIVRNGEGTQHVMKVMVTGTPNNDIARGIGKQIVNSQLVKCAISGSDPNVGRIVGAIGSYLGNYKGNLQTIFILK
jgi:glutamate N-acetyltransferase / amino-acid N-acetyltransferase